MQELIPVIAIFAVFGFPTALIGLFLRQRHLEKMRALDTQARVARLTELESARADLEARVRTLETIATSGDRDLEERLKRLTAAQREGAGDRLLRGQ
jgi:hypothetical protein